MFSTQHFNRYVALASRPNSQCRLAPAQLRFLPAWLEIFISGKRGLLAVTRARHSASDAEQQVGFFIMLQ